MKMKKKFLSPRVVQEVQICLEKDLLQGPSIWENTTTTIQGQEVVIHGVATIQGQEVVIHGVDAEGASYFDEGDWSN